MAAKWTVKEVKVQMGVDVLNTSVLSIGVKRAWLPSVVTEPRDRLLESHGLSSLPVYHKGSQSQVKHPSSLLKASFPFMLQKFCQQLW